MFSISSLFVVSLKPTIRCQVPVYVDCQMKTLVFVSIHIEALNCGVPQVVDDLGEQRERVSWFPVHKLHWRSFPEFSAWSFHGLDSSKVLN
jgi:hypothetical protein